MSAKNAFRFAANLQTREVTYTSIENGLDYTVKVSPANYMRNFEELENTVVEGKEFVIDAENFKNLSIPLPPQRGDQLEDPELGINTVDIIKPMIILGDVVGYRIRCN